MLLLGLIDLVKVQQLLVPSSHLLLRATLFICALKCDIVVILEHARILLRDLCKTIDDILKQFYLPVVIVVLVVNELYYSAQLDVAPQLLAFELQVETEFSKANGAKSEGLLVSLVQLGGTVHQALVGLTVPHGKHMTQLVTRSLNGPVLHKLRHL